MNLTVRLFATLKEQAGTSRIEIHLPAAATVADLLTRLADIQPGLAASLSTALVAVNQNYAAREQILQDGDEIAIFPPVSGG